jgi:hypothetical protein
VLVLVLLVGASTLRFSHDALAWPGSTARVGQRAEPCWTSSEPVPSCTRVLTWYQGQAQLVLQVNNSSASEGALRIIVLQVPVVPEQQQWTVEDPSVMRGNLFIYVIAEVYIQLLQNKTMHNRTRIATCYIRPDVNSHSQN